jgi:hypothetical protein
MAKRGRPADPNNPHLRVIKPNPFLKVEGRHPVKVIKGDLGKIRAAPRKSRRRKNKKKKVGVSPKPVITPEVIVPEVVPTPVKQVGMKIKSSPKGRSSIYEVALNIYLVKDTAEILNAEAHERSQALGHRYTVTNLVRDYIELGLQPKYPGHKVNREFVKPTPPPDPYARFSARQAQRLKLLGIVPPLEEDE